MPRNVPYCGLLKLHRTLAQSLRVTEEFIPHKKVLSLMLLLYFSSNDGFRLFLA